MTVFSTLRTATRLCRHASIKRYPVHRPLPHVMHRSASFQSPPLRSRNTVAPSFSVTFPSLPTNQTSVSSLFHQRAHFSTTNDTIPTTPKGVAQFELNPDPHIGKRATISLTTKDYPGALAQVLSLLTENDINMTRIESRYGQNATQVNFFIDVDVPANHRRVSQVLQHLKKYTLKATMVPAIRVPWFPITAEEVDSVALLVLDGGTDLEADHPGFHDADYKQRRNKITEAAAQFRFGDSPSIVDYSPEEIECWNIIWRKLKPLLFEHGCPQYIEAFEGLQKHCGYKEGNIPQLADVSGYLYDKTGFRLRPTAGLLSSRHFLNGLAFNTFFCTQYLRHHSVPFYTPEPDVVHELVGHAPMFADPEFAKFSQEIGLASIGATDEQIEQLARCYWFSVEFGLCKESPSSNVRKVYGAGILSSFGEIEYAMSDEPEIRAWDPRNAAKQPFPITKYQPLYYLAESFEDATVKMREFANSLDKPFTCRWNDVKEKLYVDRNVQREERKKDDFGEYIGDA
eukprot:CAMPEP_0197075102 /NCGR_PEP_ID=MMETSP1384-20130603/211442_1 /TAXON_ID=29189 /ORGANISM="Ammonia sp." /LENGTH=513 /DNA_ID=CAMNT_0042513945 /DNA_START=8 /DNA_END=1549 /DNA_ORIENTATION=+